MTTINIRNQAGDVIRTVQRPEKELRRAIRNLAHEWQGEFSERQVGTPRSSQVSFSAEFPDGTWCKETEVFYH